MRLSVMQNDGILRTSSYDGTVMIWDSITGNCCQVGLLTLCDCACELVSTVGTKGALQIGHFLDVSLGGLRGSGRQERPTEELAR